MTPARPTFSTDDILAARGPRNEVDPWRPYAFLVEPEHSARGRVEQVATVFLTNRECPFHCLMCDLWQNTTESTVPVGAIPAQIEYALARLPMGVPLAEGGTPAPVTHIKLYNSGNFFDARAIRPEDHADIIARLRPFETVIVENHPRLCGPQCVEFCDRLERDFEIALGLETVHPEVLPRLNKQMTLADFDRAVEDLHAAGIRTRAFILLRPPFLSEAEGVDWALRSIEHAFSVGVNCCSVVPTRGGNGIMEHLSAAGQYAPPALASLETVLSAGLALGRGRVLMDLWDAERFATCPDCAPERIARLRRMNLAQCDEPTVQCHCG